MKAKKLIEQELEIAPEVKKPQPQKIAPWYSPEAMRRSKIAAIETDIARMKQQIINLKRQIQIKEEEKRNLQNPPGL